MSGTFRIWKVGLGEGRKVRSGTEGDLVRWLGRIGVEKVK